MRGISLHLSRRETLVLSLFSSVLALCVVLGAHIRITGDIVGGTVRDNYISPYGPIDVLIGIAVFTVSLILSATVYLATSRRSVIIDSAPICLRSVFPLMGTIFCLWLPYLFLYWPGFIFVDTFSSFDQALGFASYSDHHPFLYTLFIKVCLKTGRVLGIGNGGGAALYCLVQMSAMAFVLAYLARWVQVRGSFRNRVAWVIAMCFGLSRYVGTLSIAIWKDPLFSIAVAGLCPLLFDDSLRGREATHRLPWLTGFTALCLVMVFGRNNGRYIMLLLAVVMIAQRAVSYVRSRRESRAASGRRPVDPPVRSQSPMPALIAVSVLALSFIITGPVYSHFGVARSPKVESLGLFLDQMARVAAVGGEMSEDDRAYLDSLLPLEKYRDTYHPCCTDLLKWDPEFNAAALEDGFWRHWLSLFLKNPLIYFEAWELQTYGFWTVSVPAAWTSGNIVMGVPANTNDVYYYRLEPYGIDASMGYRQDVLHAVFPGDSTSIPVGVCLWLMLFAGVCLVLRGGVSWAMCLVPPLGLVGTLVIASPIGYWPRYGAAVQMLIPFFVGLIVLSSGLRKTS